MSTSETGFRNALAGLPLGGLRFFGSIGSSNDEALAWAAQGAPDLSLVFADEQTSGRGRMGRKWFTPPGSALAFSLVLCPNGQEQAVASLISGLGALALTDALSTFGLAAQIKWPNDVLVRGRKLAGILVESVWVGERIESVVLGMGVNVAAAAVPPAEQLLFPATSVETEGVSVDRWALLREILVALVARRALMGQPGFVADWEARLAFNGEPVQVWSDPSAPLTGVVRGLEADGSLKLETAPGILQSIRYGELHLRPNSL